MVRIPKDSYLSVIGRFGIPPLIGGGAVTAWAVYSAKAGKIAINDNFWLGLTMSATITLIGVGILVYGWWLDRRENRPIRKEQG